MQFIKAVKSQARLRMALIGPAGSGKTYSAIQLATTMTPGKVAVIDTEHGSAAKYADLFAFDVLNLTNFDPMNYVEAISAAVKAGYETVVIDSLTHAWNGVGGALHQVDQAAARSKSGSTFNAWRDVTPKQILLVESILQCRAHVIATVRSKIEYVLENGKPRKVGMAPVQREGLEYEFDIVGEMDNDHKMIITKSRCPALADQVIDKPGRAVANEIAAWLQGAPVVETVAREISPPVDRVAKDSPALIAPDVLTAIVKARPAWYRAQGIDHNDEKACAACWSNYLWDAWKVRSAKELSKDDGEKLLKDVLTVGHQQHAKEIGEGAFDFGANATEK